MDGGLNRHRGFDCFGSEAKVSVAEAIPDGRDP